MHSIEFSQLQQVSGGWGLKSFLKRAGILGAIYDALDNLPDIREGFYDGYNGNTPRHQAS